jgi:hypothetical protein
VPHSVHKRSVQIDVYHLWGSWQQVQGRAYFCARNCKFHLRLYRDTFWRFENKRHSRICVSHRGVIHWQRSSLLLRHTDVRSTWVLFVCVCVCLWCVILT